MKKISLTFALILLMVVLAIPVSAELDYTQDTPPQELVTIDDVIDVPLAETIDIPGDEDPEPIEEIEIELSPVPLGDMPGSGFTPGESITPPVVPQTGDKMLTPIVLLITSVLGVGVATVFLKRRKAIKI